MMKEIGTLFLIVLSHGGHWFGGASEKVAVQWNLDKPPADARVVWRLECGDAGLASGELALPAARRSSAFTLRLPEVRAQTPMTIVYRVEQQSDRKVLAEGRKSVRLYPTNLLAGVAERMAGKKLFVWDEPSALPAVLTRAKIEHVAIDREPQLQFTAPDVLIVGNDRLGSDTLEQTSIVSLAAAGSSVLLLEQTKCPGLAGYVLSRRAAPAKLAWREDHPLTRALRPLDPSGSAADVWAIQLPADEPALEIAWWSYQMSRDKPVPIDALVAVKAIGKGRLAMCQIRINDWNTDPRAQEFLAAALDYAASPPEPTPAPSHRLPPLQPAVPVQSPAIVIP